MQRKGKVVLRFKIQLDAVFYFTCFNQQEGKQRCWCFLSAVLLCVSLSFCVSVLCVCVFSSTVAAHEHLCVSGTHMTTNVLLLLHGQNLCVVLINVTDCSSLT